jgi:HSP20 family molecular chaperone IbpA
VDLTSAAEGLGLGLGQKHARSADSDFEPRTDIFDTPQEYTVHVSLPGAKKSDIGVDWDGDHSVLRIAGVVHRPGVDEEMMARLVVDGRKRETGVFEKTIRLGTPRAPAAVDVEAISAKMVDGVLVVRVPKAEKQFAKKQVRVGSASPAVSAERHDETYMDAYMDEKEHEREHEKDLLFDADEDMYDGAPEQHHGRSETVRAAESEVDTKTGKGKQREAEEETAARERDDRSETIGVEYPHAKPNATATAATTETLPRYEIEEPAESKLAKEGHQTPSQSQEELEDDNMSDWEKDGSDPDAGAEDEDEGEYEYVKINVD